jgi:hypothetical protein
MKIYTNTSRVISIEIPILTGEVDGYTLVKKTLVQIGKKITRYNLVFRQNPGRFCP